MAREEFIDNLRLASRMLSVPSVSSGQGAQGDDRLSSALHSADLWLTPKSVSGFVPDDFRAWAKGDWEKLRDEVAEFQAIAVDVQADKPATKRQSNQARKRLEGVIGIVRRHLLHEWLEAQEKMLKEAMAAANSNGWYAEKDEKEVRESLLGAYKAPRLRIRTPDQEVVLDPIARFGSGRRGVVDLVVMPTYVTKYLLTFKDGRWEIVSPQRAAHSRPFNQKTFANTIARLPHS